MPYICRNCPKDDQSFRQSGTETYMERRIYDSTRYLDAHDETLDTEAGDLNDSGDSDFEDSDYDGDIICDNCGELAEDVTEEEYDTWIGTPTKKDITFKVGQLVRLKGTKHDGGWNNFTSHTGATKGSTAIIQEITDQTYLVSVKEPNDQWSFTKEDLEPYTSTIQDVKDKINW